MIDLVLQGTIANLRALLVARGLVVEGADRDGNVTYNVTPGFDYCLWAGTGKFPTGPGTTLAGLVIIARIRTDDDEIHDSDDGEQWSRSQVAKYIKTNGVLGTFGGFPCYTLNSVRMMRAADVFAWCLANNQPPHEWAGGNAL